MAKSYIHEIGDKLSHGSTAANLPAHVKEIAPVMYNDGSDNYNSIQSKLNEKAPLSSPAFTGVPEAPNPETGTNTSQIATTAFVKVAVDNAPDVKVKATEKTDDHEYILLATYSATHASGTATEATYKTGVTINPSTHTINAKISGFAATADIAEKVKKYDPTFVGDNSIKEAFDKKLDAKDFKHIGLKTQYVADDQRLVLSDMKFSTIYPVVGKYGLAIFRDSAGNNLDPDQTEFSGDREWLLDWRPYVIDMSKVAGEVAKTPVAELKKNNWLRKIDGTYAQTCCVKDAQLHALDGKQASLVWGNDNIHSATLVATLVPSAYNGDSFVPEKFWEYVKEHYADVNTEANTSYTCGIEVEVYDGSNTHRYAGPSKTGSNHIPAPWETTETKYSIVVGREKDCYLIDGSSATTGEHMRGLTAKPVYVGSSKFDPEFFRLRRTGIAPGLCTKVTSYPRCFFYNYAGEATTSQGDKGSATTSIFYNNGTYPVVNISQFGIAGQARNSNYGGTNGRAYPVGEAGFHAYNSFMCSIEAAYGTRNLWTYSRFSPGIASNEAASDTTGGCIIDGTYYKWSDKSITIQGTANYTICKQVNSTYPKFQCVETQIAASLAAEMGISAGTNFHWNGGTWHYEIPAATPGIANVQSLLDGHMNCRIYKMTDTVTVNSHTVACNLVAPLTEGVNLSGDIWWSLAGGCELVYETTGTGRSNYKYSFYLEPDQTKWITGAYATSATTENEYHADGSKFEAESKYAAIVTDSVDGMVTSQYANARHGYTPVRRVFGNNLNYGECYYDYRPMDEASIPLTVGSRSRRRIYARGGAHDNHTSPRFLMATGRPSSTSADFGIAFQVLLA